MTVTMNVQRFPEKSFLYVVHGGVAEKDEKLLEFNFKGLEGENL